MVAKLIMNWRKDAPILVIRARIIVVLNIIRKRHSPILAKDGRKPLYKAAGPSPRT